MWKVATAVFLLCAVSVCKSSNITTFYRLEGNSVSISFKRPPNLEEILCTFKGNKILEWEAGKNVLYFGNFTRRTKLTVDTIEIQNLQQTDSGIYRISFINQNGFTTEESFILVVSAPLLQPTINCTANGTSIHLECKFEDSLSATIQWLHQGKAVGQDDNFDLTLENKWLTILNPKGSSGEYACIVKKHEDRAQSDPINIEKCYSRGNSRGHVALIALVVVFVASAMIVAFAFYWYKRKNGNVQNTVRRYEVTNVEDRSIELPEGDGVETKPSPSSE
ncbi:peroxidasin homolog isoform X2 [Mobula birostris]